METNKVHIVGKISFSGNFFNIQVDGKNLSFELGKISSILPTAKKEELNNFKISPSGYGIHWPQLDEDISIDGLLSNLEKKVAT